MRDTSKADRRGAEEAPARLPEKNGEAFLSSNTECSRKGDPAGNDRTRKAAVDALRSRPTEENLWNCVIAFQKDPFWTVSGLPFSYSLKVGRSGEYTKELFIDRREHSKSLSWSSFRIAFEKALEKKGTVFARPKEVADVRGVSYSFSLLWRFGVIRVPKEAEEKLRGRRKREEM